MKNAIFRCTVLLLLMLIFSCTKDRDDESFELGTWIESAPVPERTTLYFGTGNRLTKLSADGSEEVYRYRIEGKTLYLSLYSGLEGSSELIFERINQNTIKVENLYPSIPEMETTFIIFERY